MQNIIHRLNANHKTMILIRNLILPTPKPATTPYIFRLQRRQNLGETSISFKRGRRVSMGEFTVINADDFIVCGEEVCVDGSLDGVGDEVWLVNGFQARFGDFKHERPVGAFFCRCGVGFVAVCELQGWEASVRLGLVVGGVIREDGRSIEWAIGFGEVELLSETREKGAEGWIPSIYHQFVRVVCLGYQFQRHEYSNNKDP